MASLMQKISTLIQGSLHELVDKAMREKSLAVIDVYIRDAGDGLTELNDAIGTLQANLTGFQRERDDLQARATDLDEATNRFLLKGDNTKAQATSAELMHVKDMIAMHDKTIDQATKDLAEQRRGKDILQTRINTMRYEREKLAALIEMAKAKEANLHARQKASAVCFDRSFPLCQMTAGRTPRRAAWLARRSTAARPTDDNGRCGSTSGPTASP